MKFNQFKKLKSYDFNNSKYKLGHKVIIDDLLSVSNNKVNKYKNNGEKIDPLGHLSILENSLTVGFYKLIALILLILNLIVYFIVRIFKFILFSSSIYIVFIYPIAYLFELSCRIQSWCYLNFEEGVLFSESEKKELEIKFEEANRAIVYETFYK